MKREKLIVIAIVAIGLLYGIGLAVKPKPLEREEMRAREAARATHAAPAR